MAAGQDQRFEANSLPPQFTEHVVSKFVPEGRIVAPAHHQETLASLAKPVHVWYGADGRPVTAKLVLRYLRPQSLPDMHRRHASADSIGKIRGDVQKCSGADCGVMRNRDRTDSGTNARADKAQPRVALPFEPAQAAPRVRNRLARGLQREADVRPDQLIGALVAR